MLDGLIVLNLIENYQAIFQSYQDLVCTTHQC